jgi:hypothetical protein
MARRVLFIEGSQGIAGLTKAEKMAKGPMAKGDKMKDDHVAKDKMDKKAN